MSTVNMAPYLPPYQSWLMTALEEEVSPIFCPESRGGIQGYLDLVAHENFMPVALTLDEYKNQLVTLVDFHLTYPTDDDLDRVIEYLEGGLWYRVPITENADDLFKEGGFDWEDLWTDWRYFFSPILWCPQCRLIDLSPHLTVPDVDEEEDEVLINYCNRCSHETITYSWQRKIGFPKLKYQDLSSINSTNTSFEKELMEQLACNLNQLPACFEHRRGNSSINRKNLRIRPNQVYYNFWELFWLRILELCEESPYIGIVEKDPVSGLIREYIMLSQEDDDST